MITFRIKNNADNFLSLGGSLVLPAWGRVKPCEFPTHEAAHLALKALGDAASEHGYPMTARTLWACTVEPWSVDNRAEGALAWDACVRLKETALWTLPLFVADAPAHLFKIGEGVTA